MTIDFVSCNWCEQESQVSADTDKCPHCNRIGFLTFVYNKPTTGRITIAVEFHNGNWWCRACGVSNCHHLHDADIVTSEGSVVHNNKPNEVS